MVKETKQESSTDPVTTVADLVTFAENCKDISGYPTMLVQMDLFEADDPADKINRANHEQLQFEIESAISVGDVFFDRPISTLRERDTLVKSTIKMINKITKRHPHFRQKPKTKYASCNFCGASDVYVKLRRSGFWVCRRCEILEGIEEAVRQLGFL